MSTLAGFGLILIGLALFVGPVLQYRFARRIEEFKAEIEHDRQFSVAALERAHMAAIERSNLVALKAQAAAVRELMDYAHELGDDGEGWKR